MPVTERRQSPAETLRALSAVQASIATEYAEAPMKAAVHDEYAAACDAGAQAYEIVERLANETAIIDDDMEPTHYCRFCQCVADEVDEVEHDPTCIWQRARSLLHGSHQLNEDNKKTSGS